MATANIFHREVVANKSPRNAFDMAYSTLFSSPAGMLLPCYVQEVQAGDKLKVGVTSITRTSPLVRPAFMTFDEKVDFWAVPIRLIWSDYKQWKIAQTFRHRTTNAGKIGSQNFLPFTTFDSISKFFKGQTGSITTSPFKTQWYAPNAVSAYRYLDLLGYSVPNSEKLITNLTYSSTFQDLIASNQPGTSVGGGHSRPPGHVLDGTSPVDCLAFHYEKLSKFTPCNYFRLAAFQCIYQHCYRNEEYEVLDPTYYNVDNLFNNLEADNTTSVSESVILRNSTNYYLHPFGPGASLPLILPSPLNSRLTLAKLFTPHYKNWRKDVFTSAKPSNGFAPNHGFEFSESSTDTGSASSTYGSGFYWPQNLNDTYSPISGIEGTDPDPYNPLNEAAESLGYDYDRINWTFQTKGDPYRVVQRLFTEIQKDSLTKEEFGSTFLYPQNIRNLMAQDKYLRSAIYADKNLSSQIKALFGYDEPDPHSPIYLGSYSTDVTIDDVTSTSDGLGPELPSGKASSSILGQLAGKVRQSNNDGSVFSTTFKEDCIVIGVHYVMPRNNYDSYRLNKWNTKLSRFDYFNPNFDGLGLQPVLSYERFIDTTSLWDTNYLPSSLFGFAPRYYEYKQRQNEVHGAFQYGQSDQDWTLTNNFPFSKQISADNKEIYKITPNITDRIFNTGFDGSIASDPFQHYYYFDATLVSDMEIYGTPKL